MSQQLPVGPLIEARLDKVPSSLVTEKLLDGVVEGLGELVHGVPAGLVVGVQELAHHGPQLRVLLADPTDCVKNLHSLVALILALLYTSCNIT